MSIGATASAASADVRSPGETAPGDVSPPPGITVDIKATKDEVPMKFVVQGASTWTLRIDDTRTVELTLNGQYCRTPNSTYSCVQSKATGKDASYQVLLLPLPKPHAQIEVLRMHNGFLDQTALEAALGEAGSTTIAETEPMLIFEKVRKELSASMPHFAFYAAKSRST